MKVYVTRPIIETGIELLKSKNIEVEVNPENRSLSREELKAKFSAGYDGILVLLTDKIDAEIINNSSSNLKIIANYAVGFDNVDVAAATERKIFVTNTPGVLTEAVAEHTFALLVATAKRIVEADKFIREGQYLRWEPKGFLGPQISGKIIGIVGLGRIGTMVAEIAKSGFNMNVIYYDVKRDEGFEREFNAGFKELDQLLSQADFVSIHVPLLPETKHLINEQRLKLMKPSAILINTSRGPVIDEVALVEALKQKTILGAGLDVFENEPKLTPGLIELPNVVLTPHTASATNEARAAMSRLAAENIIATLSGQAPPNLVK